MSRDCIMKTLAQTLKGRLGRRTDQGRAAGEHTLFGRGASVKRPSTANEAVLRTAIERAGIEFIDENGADPGVRLRKPIRQKGR